MIYENITNYWREIFDPSGSNISQLNRCSLYAPLRAAKMEQHTFKLSSKILSGAF